MASVNKVILIGNLTRDPELKFTQGGTAFCNFGLAVNQPYTTEGGEKREDVLFVDITFWKKAAETITEYLKKGAPIYIEGKLKLDTWDDKQTGAKRSKISVVGQSFQFLGGKKEEGGGEEGGGNERQQQRGGGYQKAPSQQQRRPPVDPELDAMEDDIPF